MKRRYKFFKTLDNFISGKELGKIVAGFAITSALASLVSLFLPPIVLPIFWIGVFFLMIAYIAYGRRIERKLEE